MMMEETNIFPFRQCFPFPEPQQEEPSAGWQHVFSSLWRKSFISDSQLRWFTFFRPAHTRADSQQIDQRPDNIRVNPALNVSSAPFHVDQSSLPKFFEMMGNGGRINAHPLSDFTDTLPDFRISGAFGSWGTT